MMVAFMSTGVVVLSGSTKARLVRKLEQLIDGLNLDIHFTHFRSRTTVLNTILPDGYSVAEACPT